MLNGVVMQKITPMHAQLPSYSDKPYCAISSNDAVLVCMCACVDVMREPALPNKQIGGLLWRLLQ